ncbi:Tyrosine-protein phosphatase 10D [Frankliniella fusca]|uniref:Tyrosine-protein phosphatase 10D n=1 Tax=Frankliniella fusca TaxID=407009 RepID=A0AAE1HHF8_9NEOP|nr:Tyrosine-protein phosphatase 10D [Frankliniella fusca]KAK3917869.1 Tyrosine-protein phosphatase 10D [Frankliniella fusca]KAK3921422.1 Tyrosine-protein phosphatase 10D [Frankliniella fusca]KAK3921629.1 Tyrosine-protein phosphatase 10D [Frankliniella fusca]KAK3923347.1 Tyrosine-protein phosphatase 10D [Frankliniella fusca]
MALNNLYRDLVIMRQQRWQFQSDAVLQLIRIFKKGEQQCRYLPQESFQSIGSCSYTRTVFAVCFLGDWC